MAPEVIDLISSSPPDSGPSAPTVDGHAQPSTIRRPKAHIPNDFAFLSDDFDSSIDIDEPILVDATGNKRKLPPVREASRALKRASPASALPPIRSNGKSRAYVPDPINLTSSPAPQEITARFKPGSPLGGASKCQHQLPDSDPFASSPRPRPPQTHPTKVLSSDPFASSPQLQNNVISESLPPDRPAIPQKVTAATVSSNIARLLSSDPFASSPTQGAVVSPKPARAVYSRDITATRARPLRSADWDPISSSAPEVLSFEGVSHQKPVLIDIEDSDSDSDEFDDEFPDISNFDIEKCRQKLQRTQSEVIAPKSRKPNTQRSADERKRERDAKAAARDLHKENKRRERQEIKAAKAREKERTAALAEVNKLRTDKKISTPEMLVDIPSSLNQTTTTQLEALLEGLDVQFTAWESPVENVVKWRRKVRSQYNNDLGLWEPTSLHIENEKHALVVLTANEFVKLALESRLDTHVNEMKQHFCNHKIIYLLEGVTPWMRKNRNLRNRQFTSLVRSQDPTPQPTRRRANVTQEYVPEETIEDALLQLQIMHEVLIHHTTISLETAQWIAIFTQHVSTIPYKKQRDQATIGAGFCMESGQVKTGDDAKDTYVRMLQEIVRVTAPIAYGIMAEFTNVCDLVHALDAQGPNTLEQVRKSANKDGAFSDRTVGQAVSRRMHRVFTGKDETSTDV